MQLVLLHTDFPEIEIITIPDTIANEIEDMEEYIDRTLGYNPYCVSWQCYYGSNDDLKIRIHEHC